jgi:hypothetical protein
MPEIDLDTNNRDRETSSADREAGICEEGHARGFEEAADGCVVAMAERVEIREPDTSNYPRGPRRTWGMAEMVKVRGALRG